MGVLDESPGAARTAALTIAALIAFAANSILCRLALRGGLIEPATFAGVRLASGALLLAAISALRGERVLASPRASALPAALLFLYALPFTFAYVDLPAGTGSLILFGSVQLTMVLAAFRSGHRPTPVEISGLAVAFGGLVLLTAPGVDAPSPAGSGLMALAGVAWGLYTMRGKRSGSPLADTGNNFILAALPAVILAGALLPSSLPSPGGIWLGIASGAIASGLGYAVWYAALRGLTPVRAAVVQVATPIIAAAAGVALLDEAATVRLLVSGAAVTGGIILTIYGQQTHPRTTPR
jgi:drug/metabolite transporter (DMT)-like permease